MQMQNRMEMSRNTHRHITLSWETYLIVLGNGWPFFRHLVLGFPVDYAKTIPKHLASGFQLHRSSGAHITWWQRG